jgi:hypothetical protein
VLNYDNRLGCGKANPPWLPFFLIYVFKLVIKNYVTLLPCLTRAGFKSILYGA